MLSQSHIHAKDFLRFTPSAPKGQRRLRKLEGQSDIQQKAAAVSCRIIQQVKSSDWYLNSLRSLARTSSALYMNCMSTSEKMDLQLMLSLVEL